MSVRLTLAVMALFFSSCRVRVAAFVPRPLSSCVVRVRTAASLRAAPTEATATTPVPIDTNLSMDDIISLCKRRGFIFPSSEIYNGYAGFYDYGPLGAELKKNVKDAWWKQFVTRREDVVGLDSSIIHNPATWKSSGTLLLVGFETWLVV
jgi:glycyl-tRNA synthetase